VLRRLHGAESRYHILVSPAESGLFAQTTPKRDKVRESPLLFQRHISEILRLEAPIQGFSRYVASDNDKDGIQFRVAAIVFYALQSKMGASSFPDRTGLI